MASRTSVVPPLRTNPSAASPSGTPTPRQLIVASAAAAALYAGYAAQRRRPLAVPKPWEAALAANTAYAIALSRAATAGAPPGPETHRGVSDFLSTLKARVLNGSGYAAPSLLSNELVVEFTEFVDVPDHNVHDCVEMELPARGEVRVHSYVDRPLRATLRLANNATPSSARTASFRAGEGTVPADNAASRTASMMAPCIPTSRTLCDIVDERYAVASGNQLRFVPGRAETNLIMSYETTTAYDVEPAVVCRECRISPDSTVGQLRLRIQLKVEKPALDVCVQIVLPKRGELRSSPSLSCGTWGRPEGGAPNEFQWLAGDVGVAAGDELSSVTDSLSDVHAKELWCEWVFYIPSNSGADVSFRSARNTPRERRAANGVQDLDESITAAVDANPSVSLSYTSKTSASGLKARRITIEERGEDGQWVPWSDSDPERTVTTSASYRTMYSQQLRVLTDD